jgi:2-isopropylmalate synthase
MKRIKIFDTTLRDGEQSPGCSMNLAEKIEVAKQLERLKVDVIEAGFAISSPGDFESVKTIAESVSDCTVASLARCKEGDIDAAWNAVKGAADPRIHVFLATGDVHSFCYNFIATGIHRFQQDTLSFIICVKQSRCATDSDTCII